MNSITDITKIFYSDRLTDHKFDLVYRYAVTLNEYKNKFSVEFFENKSFFLNPEFIKNKYAYVSYIRKLYPGLINCYYAGPLYEKIYIDYKNREESIVKQLKFYNREFVRFELYKKNCKNGKKGLLKQVVYKNHETDLSMVLTYLSKCEKILDLNKVIERLKSDELADKVRYKLLLILRLVDKVGYERLWNLALLRRNTTLSKYNKPIIYKSLTFEGEVLKKYFIKKKNKNHNSNISTFATIILPGLNKEIYTKSGKLKYVDTIDIPIKMSGKYHGSRNQFIKQPMKNGKCSYKFRVCLDEYNRSLNFHYCLKDLIKQIPENKENFIGIDVNVKHNLFSLSDGTVYDYDRKLVHEYLEELNKIDVFKKQAKKQSKKYVISKKRQHKLDIYKDCIKHSEERLISNMCKDLVSKGIDHIVLEDLDNKFKRSYSKSDEYEEKYNRINHILNIGSLKDKIKSISNKYDIQVSFILAEYTSQMCSHCGCIHSENRLNQEDFCCIECGYTDNADHNAAINIRNRVAEAVLCTSLLNKLPDGSYITKSIKHDKIKEIIHRGVIQLHKMLKL